MKAILITFECFCEELEVEEVLSLFSDFGKSFFFFFIAAHHSFLLGLSGNLHGW